MIINEYSTYYFNYLLSPFWPTPTYILIIVNHHYNYFQSAFYLYIIFNRRTINYHYDQNFDVRQSLFWPPLTITLTIVNNHFIHHWSELVPFHLSWTITMTTLNQHLPPPPITNLTTKTNENVSLFTTNHYYDKPLLWSMSTVISHHFIHHRLPF